MNALKPTYAFFLGANMETTGKKEAANTQAERGWIEMTDKEVLEALAGGAVIERDDLTLGGWRVITRHGGLDSEQVRRLSDAGYLDGFANGGGARLSEEGRLAYIRSTDELQERVE